MVNALLLTAWLGCQSFDTVSTMRALNRGAFEANPILSSSRPRLMTIKVSINVGMLVWYRKETRQAAKRGISTGMALGGCLAGAWNMANMPPRTP